MDTRSTASLLFVCVSLLSCWSSVSAYYGKEIGPLSSFAHHLSGVVYAVDENRIRIRNFVYDGEAPAAYFWIGLKGKQSANVDDSGIAISDENGRLLVLSKYENADITLMLPPMILVKNLVWFSVWCKQFKIDFGHVLIPDNFDAPKPTVIGQFSQLEHGVRSDNVTVLNAKLILIKNFYHDGQGKDVYFAAGNKEPISNIPNDSGLFVIVPRLDEGLKALSVFAGSDVILMLPADLYVFNVTFVSAYSKSENRIYGQVTIPKDLNVPPFVNPPLVPIRPK